MRRVAVICVVISAALLAVAGGAAAAPVKPGILYSLDAKGARVTATQGALRLSLPANAPVTWFADRPARSAGSINLKMLTGIWAASGFAADPPNAALILTESGRERIHVVELSRPRFANGRVTFRMRRLPDATTAKIHDRDAIVPGGYARAQVFIDDGDIAPCSWQVASWGQCLLAPYQEVYLGWVGIGNPGTVTACFDFDVSAPEADLGSYSPNSAVVVFESGASPQLPVATCPTQTTILQQGPLYTPGVYVSEDSVISLSNSSMGTATPILVTATR